MQGLTPAAIPAFVYLLPHQDQPRFKIGKARSVPEREKQLPDDIDIDRAYVLEFDDEARANNAERMLHRMAFRHHIADLPQQDGYTEWYDIACFAQLLASIQAELAGWLDIKSVKPAREVYPVDDADARAAKRAQREARAAERKLRDEVFRVHREELARLTQAAELADHRNLLAGDGWISPNAKHDVWAPALTHLFARLGVCAKGFAELDRSRDNDWRLMFWVPVGYAPEVKRIGKQLEACRAFEHTPAADSLPGDVWIAAPFARLLTLRRKKNGNKQVQGYLLTIRPTFEYFEALLAGMQPQIRGWDLVLDEPVLRFDPAKSARFNAGSSRAESLPQPCAARILWQKSTNDIPRAMMQFFADRSRMLLWEPPALRYSPASCDEEDSPCILARLTDLHARIVGFEQIDLNTGNRILEAFEGESLEGAAIRMWTPKPVCAVATSLEDAISIQGATRAPTCVAPTPSLLRNFAFDDCVTQMTVYLPGNPNAELREAAYDLARRAEAAKVDVRCVVPRAVVRRAATLPAVSWAEHLRTVTKIKPAMREELTLASLIEAPLLQAETVAMLPESVVPQVAHGLSALQPTALVTSIRALGLACPAISKVGSVGPMALAA